MELLDRHLAQHGPYAAGAAFTLADVVLGLSLNRWLMTPFERPNYAALAAYQSGRVEFINLLDAQRALREARMGFYKASVALMQSLADLERAVGKELP